jgi:hypothetical protein
MNHRLMGPSGICNNKHQGQVTTSESKRIIYNKPQILFLLVMEEEGY